MKTKELVILAVVVFVVSLLAGMLWGCEMEEELSEVCAPCEVNFTYSNGQVLCKCVEYKLVNMPVERKAK